MVSFVVYTLTLTPSCAVWEPSPFKQTPTLCGKTMAHSLYLDKISRPSPLQSNGARAP